MYAYNRLNKKMSLSFKASLNIIINKLMVFFKNKNNNGINEFFYNYKL